MSNLMKLPKHYPMTANSGIADANAFTIGERNVIHIPASFPDGNKVTALCGTYGYATERDSRIAHWSSGYVETDVECTTCAARAGR